MNAIINTGKITDIRKVRTVEDLWAYQPPRRELVPFDPSALTGLCKQATKSHAFGSDEWICLVAVLWAARTYKDHGGRFKGTFLDVQRSLKAARNAPTNDVGRRAVTKQNRAVARILRCAAAQLHSDKMELEIARMDWVEDIVSRSPMASIRQFRASLDIFN